MFDFLSSSFSSIFSSLRGSKLTQANMQDALEKVRSALLEADVPYATAQKFVDEVSAEAEGKKVLSSLKPSEQLVKIVHDRLVSFLSGGTTQSFSLSKASSVMVMGLQGSGKTTTIGKLMRYQINQAHKKGSSLRILCGSVDFYRPAALEQLEVLATSVGVDFYRSQATDPVRAAREIQDYARS